MTQRSKRKQKPPIYELKITLDDVEPLVWRRFRVDPLCTLPLLNLIIQTVMGWKNCHLHCFTARGARYTVHRDLFEDRDERLYRLASLVKTPGDCFEYLYDFGDEWKHTVILERTLQRSRSVVHPKCIDGENACPPEDVGGTYGYRRLLLVLANPELAEYVKMREWVGPTFNPTHFDLKYHNLPMWNLRGTGLPDWASVVRSD